MPVTCTELIVRFRQAPTMYRGFDPKRNYLRFRIRPDIAITIVAIFFVLGGEFWSKFRALFVRTAKVEEGSAA